MTLPTFEEYHRLWTTPPPDVATGSLGGHSWVRAWVTEYGTRILRDRDAMPILLEDPFIEEIRLRVRWGWQDALAARAEEAKVFVRESAFS